MQLAIVPILWVSALAKVLAAATPSPEASAVCQEILRGSAEIQIYPQDVANANFNEAKTHYWSSANADYTPACIVFPTSATEVSYIVKRLLEFPTVKFAVKSGGHNTNVGFSSVDGGVLISFNRLDSTNISSDHLTADVAPGARWEYVIATLESFGKTVVGARMGDVGVGGLLLGGGLSFLGAQYGLACDNVINYEVVLADATIVNANANSNTDLFWALKGGGNQFGVVTRFTLKTYPIGKVWGGIRTYESMHIPAILEATQYFIENNDDQKAAMVVLLGISVDTMDEIATVYFFYDGPTPQGTVFDKLNTLPYLSDGVETGSYSNLLISNDDASPYGMLSNLKDKIELRNNAILPDTSKLTCTGSRVLFRTTTLPNLPSTTLPNLPSTNGTELYNAIHNIFTKHTSANQLLLPGFTISIGYEPLQALTAAASVSSGGNTIRLDPKNGDRLWVDIIVSWKTADGDEIAASTVRQINKEIDAYAKEHYAGVPNTRYVEGNLEYGEYSPLFTNHAMYDQDPPRTYGGDSYARLVEIQRKVDPDGFFSKRTGGFKYH